MAIIPRRMISCLTGKAEAIAPTVRDALPFEALHPIDGMTRALEMRRYGLAEHRLVIVAPSVTLGDLRAAISDRVRAKVVGEVAQDLTKIPNDDVAEHLKHVLIT
jgi:hypothetical protein